MTIASLAGYHEALDFLFARTTGGFKFGLERTAELLDRLSAGRQHRDLVIVGNGGSRNDVVADHDAGSHAAMTVDLDD